MLRLEVGKARCAVRVDATGELGVAVLFVELLCEAITHLAVVRTLQLGNGEHTLVVARRAFQHHGGPEAVSIQLFQPVFRHIVNEDVVLPLGKRRIVDVFAAPLQP